MRLPGRPALPVELALASVPPIAAAGAAFRRKQPEPSRPGEMADGSSAPLAQPLEKSDREARQRSSAHTVAQA